MTVLLGSYSRSWCQSEIDNIVHPPRGVNTTDTTVLVPINMIKVANTKIIKAKLYKDIINEQDSIINLHKIKYNALHKEVETLQYNLNNSNKTNDNLNKSIERIKRKNRYLVSGHNDVLVVHQTHALHEVITELRPVRIGHACTFFH